MKGNGCAGSIASGVSIREDRVKEVAFEPNEVFLVERVGGNHDDAGLGKLFTKRLPVGVLLEDELADFGVDGAKLLGRREAVIAARGDQLTRLAGEARDTHHHEFVEVVPGDRKEAQPLERRMVYVFRLFEHPPIELQPRYLAVDEARRAFGEFRVEPELRLGFHRAGRRLLCCSFTHDMGSWRPSHRPADCQYDDSSCRSANTSELSEACVRTSAAMGRVIRRPAESAARSSASTSRTAALSDRSIRATR